MEEKVLSTSNVEMRDEGLSTIDAVKDDLKSEESV